MGIAGKAILITGANRGIGNALLTEALKRGATRVYAGTRNGFQHPDPRVTVLTMDVTNAAQVQHAAQQVDALDVVINNAGTYIIPDDLSDVALIEHHLSVNLLGGFRVTRAFLPLLLRSKGTILNILSLAALAPVPISPAYSISKAAASNMTQFLRMTLAPQGVNVHAAFLGPVDTDMVRALELPKATPASVAEGIFDGLEKGEEDIFPDPMSRPVGDAWRKGISKTLEGQFAAFVAPAGR